MTRRTLALLVLAAAPCAVAQERPAAPAPPPSAAKSFDLGVQVRLRGDTYRDLDLTSESVLIEASDSATLRGYADIWDGERHVAQCLIVLAAPEGDLLRCSFKRRTPFRTMPPPDFAS